MKVAGGGNGGPGYDVERAKRLGRAVLGCLLEEPALWKDASYLDVDDFVLTDHQKIFSGIAFLHEHELEADFDSVLAHLGEAFEAGDLSALRDGVVVESSKSYCRQLRQCTREREFWKLHERIAGASTVEDRLTLVDQMRDAIQAGDDGHNWRGLFHTYQ
jgi:replicative DNA helicase